MKKIFLSLVTLSSIFLWSCNDSFLDKYPLNSPTEETVFKSYDNFNAFMLPCYEVFANTTIATSVHHLGQNSHYQGDIKAGYLEPKQESKSNDYAFQKVASVASGNGWDFSFLRRVNMMLAHVDDANMSTEEKNHWKAIGYFFHSFWYMELIDRFGDVPWIETVLNDESPEAYGPRNDRKEVADNVLARLKWAEENIGDFESKDGPNMINRDCVRAVLSRFTVREGTWRKYHELGDYKKYFDECVRVSRLLMNDYPTLYTGTDGQPAAGYGEMWTTENLKGIPGIILYKEYAKDKNTAHFCHNEHTATHYVEMNQKTIDLYLMKNGKPILNEASGYHGDKTMYATFRDRDPRLYHTVMPPYKVKSVAGDYKSWSYTDNEADREYIDIMGPNEACANPGIGMKRLPAQNWSASLAPEVPRLSTSSYVSCRSGYYVWKHYNCWEENYNKANINVADKPLLKIEEVILNYAEAMCENGEFTQAVADISINRLRERAGMAHMVVSEINESFDPNRGKYYPKGNELGISVDPLLWEVRRERIIELMGEGYGFYDIRRWRMAPWFLNRPATGLWITKEEVSKVNFTLYNPETGYSDGANGNMTEGYLYLFNDPIREGKGWLEKYYLYQIPTTQLVLNPALGPNNPGWE